MRFIYVLPVALSLFLLKDFFLFLYMCLCLYECMLHVCRWPWKPEDIVRCPGAGVTGDCKWTDLGAESVAQVLCKSSKRSCLLSDLSSHLPSSLLVIISMY